MPLLSLGSVCRPFCPVDRVKNIHFQFDRQAATLSAARSALARSLSRLAVLPVVLLSGFSLPGHAAGTSYYINNLPGSNCSDGGAHTAAQPWCTFGPANRIRSFLAGDEILLARGGSWDQELSLAGRGTLSEPVTLRAYGSGPKPKILRNQAVSDICVLLTDPSYWKISDLEVGRASVGILLHFTQLFNSGITISHIEAHDNRGIWAGYSTEYLSLIHI